MDRILDQAFGQDAEYLATEEKQRLLSRLLGRLAHEIRNPLSSLNIHFQLLAEDLNGSAAPDRAQVSGRLEIIQGELHRLENIVKHFLRLARPSDLDLAPTRIGRIAAHVCALLRPEAEAQGTLLNSRIREALPVIMADADQLTQALVNLVVNALQAVGKGGAVRVEVFCAEGPEEIVVEVRDTGPGIPPEELGAVFEPYYTTKPEGSGLGLWIARQIAYAHRGTLRVQNAPEGGAVFALRLPIRSPEVSRG